MKRLRKIILPCITTVALAILLLTGSAGASAATPQHLPGACGVWSKVSSPNAGTSYNALNGVAAVSAKNVWAVGAYGNGNGGLTLVEHWNGTHWKVVASPNINGRLSDELLGVAAIAANNIWAVGDYYTASNIRQTLIEHWNGTSWSIVPSPNVANLYDGLSAISAISATNIWAVGSASGINGLQTLIEHWNGTRWSIKSSPGTGRLSGVAAIAANNVWAVGFIIASPNLAQTLAEHWNGTTWSVVKSPNVGTSFNNLNGVAAVSSSDIWAVGYSTTSSGVQQALIEHWNGTNWSVANPNVGTSFSELNGVAVVSGSNVWAVGSVQVGSSGTQPLTEQWNGTSWNVVTSPTFATPGNSLSAVAVVSATDIWAVGFISNGVQLTLIEQWNGSSWQVVPSIDPGAFTSTFLQGVAAITATNVWAVGYLLNSPPSSAQTLIEQYCC